jgi:hypothetical protein
VGGYVRDLHGSVLTPIEQSLAPQLVAIPIGSPDPPRD